MQPKSTKVLSIHHQLGKITLHAATSKEAVLRVRKLTDGSLETLTRTLGGTWAKGATHLHPKFLKVLLDHLIEQRADGYYYLSNDVVKYVNRRFATVKQ